MSEKTQSYGVNVTPVVTGGPVPSNHVTVRQLIRRKDGKGYDTDGIKEMTVDKMDDSALAQAVRDALAGKMK